MKPINIVTTNKDKFAIAKEKAVKHGLIVKQRKLETPEIQSFSVKDVAEYSAKYAAEKLKAPAIVTDAGLDIKALNGFPGPFVKYTNQWFSSKDYLNLMKGKKDRRIEWSETVAYCEPGKKPFSFTTISAGTLSIRAYGSMPGRVIQEIFIPHGKKKVGALLPDEELLEYWGSVVIAWDKLFLKIKRQNKKK